MILKRLLFQESYLCQREHRRQRGHECVARAEEWVQRLNVLVLSHFTRLSDGSPSISMTTALRPGVSPNQTYSIAGIRYALQQTASKATSSQTNQPENGCCNNIILPPFSLGLLSLEAVDHTCTMIDQVESRMTEGLPFGSFNPPARRFLLRIVSAPAILLCSSPRHRISRDFSCRILGSGNSHVKRPGWSRKRSPVCGGTRWLCAIPC
jgi:hypothetical protein